MKSKLIATILGVALVLTTAAGALTTISPEHVFATLPPEASSHASDPGQGGDHSQTPSQAGSGGTCPPDRSFPCR